MSQENVEIVRAAYDAYNRRDLDAALKDAAPEFELDWTRAVGPQKGVYRADESRAFLVDFLEAFESTWVEPDDFIEAEGQVVVPQTGYIRGRDGIEATARVALVWTIRDGAIVRICLYQQKRDALEAAGLRE
ncbi:MAG: nuclear transport factor 2 family protein [Solirubrobacterales bacterium]